MAQLRLITCAFLLLLTSVAAAGTTVENIRIWSENNKTRVVLDLSDSVEHSIFTLRGPDRLVIDLKSSRLGKENSTTENGDQVNGRGDSRCTGFCYQPDFRLLPG